MRVRSYGDRRVTVQIDAALHEFAALAARRAWILRASSESFPMAACSDVFVITLQFDAATFEWLQALRTRHFPPERNLVPVHLTLFHAASLSQVVRLKEGWSRIAQDTAVPLRFTGLKSLGTGTAVVVESARLGALRSRIMDLMSGAFSRQDSQPFAAHVTIQNKVDARAAKALIGELSRTFVEREGSGQGVLIWRYLQGPWLRDAVLPFED